MRRARQVGLLCGALVALAFGALATGQAQNRTPTGPREVSSDRRLGPLKTLNGEFPFVPSPTPEAWAARAMTLRRQVQVALGSVADAGPPAAQAGHPRQGRARRLHRRERLLREPARALRHRQPVSAGRANRQAPGGALPARPLAQRTIQRGDHEEIRRALVTAPSAFRPAGAYPLQARSVQLARMGCVVFLYDMVGYADSVQIPLDVAHGATARRGRAAPATAGVSSARRPSCGCSRSWACRRGTRRARSISSRSLPDVDAARIGVTGASGGGTQTFMLGAIDERPAVLFPAVMVSTAMQGGCTCENAATCASAPATSSSRRCPRRGRSA